MYPLLKLYYSVYLKVIDFIKKKSKNNIDI